MRVRTPLTKECKGQWTKSKVVIEITIHICDIIVRNCWWTRNDVPFAIALRALLKHKASEHFPFEFPMKTQGEIEASICEGMRRFEQEYMGRGPKEIHAHLMRDLVVVRLQGVLTAAEQQLVKVLPLEKGRNLLKEVRTHLIETARPLMEAMIKDITGVEVLSLHHDISTITGEEIVLFTLVSSPDFREVKQK